MWILVLLYRKRPALVRRLAGGWLAVLACRALIAAPGRLFLRLAGARLPYPAPVSLDVVALVLAPLVLIGLAVLADRRAARTAGRDTRTTQPTAG